MKKGIFVVTVQNPNGQGARTLPYKYGQTLEQAVRQREAYRKAHPRAVTFVLELNTTAGKTRKALDSMYRAKLAKP